jgi:FkbM family methyltransferase
VLKYSQREVTIEGTPIRVRLGRNDAFWGRYEAGVWEPDTQAVFRRFIDKQHSYIDVGAWIGPTLLQGCQLARRAYGIEPDPVAYAELAENIEDNRVITGNVQLFNICIAPVSGKVSFGSRREGGDTMSSLLFSGAKTSWMVDGMNFQEWTEQNEIGDCNFIKIDIEGGEYSVLPTMAKYLRRQRPTLLLSLHPCFIGDLAAKSIEGRFRRAIFRLRNTMNLLKIVQFYRHMYDPLGKVPGSTISSLRTRIHHALAVPTWKPVVFLVLALRSVLGKPSVLVLTDQPW